MICRSASSALSTTRLFCCSCLSIGLTSISAGLHPPGSENIPSQRLRTFTGHSTRTLGHHEPSQWPPDGSPVRSAAIRVPVASTNARTAETTRPWSALQQHWPGCRRVCAIGRSPPVFDLYAEVRAMLRITEGAAVGQCRTRRHLTGRPLRRLVPAGVGVVQTHFRARPEIRTGRRPGRRHGELAQLARAVHRVDLIVTDLADQLELFCEGIAAAPTDRQPVLILAIRTHILLVDE